jgi:hypothetical protein
VVGHTRTVVTHTQEACSNVVLRSASLTDEASSGKKHNFDLGITLECQIIRILELLDVGLNKSSCI